MKRWISLMIALIALMTIGAHAEGLEKVYSEAELMMVAGDYTGAAAKFDALGAYSDASQMAMYCKAVAAAETLGMYDVAVDAFTKLGDFKDSNQMAVYYLARGHEAAGAAIGVLAEASDDSLNDAAESYENAVTIYVELSLFKDSLTRMASCQEQITAIENEQTAREEAATEAKYQQAVALESEGKYAEALILYIFLDGYKDSNVRAAACQSILDAEKTEADYQAALALEAAGKYEEAVSAFEALAGYKDSDERRTACEESINEDLYQSAAAHQQAGEYGKAATLYKKLGDYKDSAQQLFICEEALSPYSRIGTMSNKRVVVVSDGKYGYKDENGYTVIPCQYEYAGEFVGNYAPAKKDDGYGIIDIDGNVVIPFKYDGAGTFDEEGLALVYKKDKWGFVNKKGKVVIPFEYYRASKFTNGLAVVSNGKWGCIDATGNVVVDFIYEDVSRFYDGFAIVKDQQNLWGIIDTEGNQVVTCQYEALGSVYEGLAQVFEDGKYGYINTTGELVVPCEYDECTRFSDGLAAVKKDGKWFFIDQTNTVVLTCDYDTATYFSDGISFVKSGDKYGFMDETGTLIVPCEYDDASYPIEGAVRLQKNEKWGIVDTSGNWLFPCEYDDITYNEGYFVLLKDTKVTVIDREDIQPGYKEILAQQEQEREAARNTREQEQLMLKVYSDKETVKSAQSALNAAGYDCGTPDGIAGKGTSAAISQYQTDKALNVTGTVTHELLVSLGVIEE